MAKPLVFLTGFFGSGKTTLLRSLISGLKKRNLTVDVILNDFTNAELDSATLGDDAASIVPIAASCACCDSLDELVSLCTIAGRSSADALLIELNGTADPLSLLEAFTLIESRIPFFPRLQVGLADARHWGQRCDWSPLEKRQIETAGYWILTHEDEVTKSRLDEVSSDISSEFPYAIQTNAAKLLDVLANIIRKDTETEPQPPSPPHLAVSPQAPHPKLDSVHRLSHQFTGCQIPLPSRVRRRTIEDLLVSLPDWVIRAKALVKLVESPGENVLFQRSGSDPLPPPFPVPHIDKVSPSLVCIGACLDKDVIQKLAEEHFGKNAANLPQ